MRVLIVKNGFFPGIKYGGPPVSVDNFCSLMKEHQCFVVSKDHDKDDTTPYANIEEGSWVTRDNCTAMYLSDEHFVYKKFDEIIKEVKPDIIYLQSFFERCALKCLMLGKKYGIKVLVAPRGELCAGAISLKKLKKMTFIKIFRALGLFTYAHYHSTSDEETEAIVNLLGVKREKIHFLTNIPSIPKKDYPRTEKVSGEGRFIFLSRIHPKKNLISAIKAFKGVTGNVSFDIYGPLEDKEYWVECQKEIAELSENIKVNYCGLISHEEVHETFSKYDAFVFPTFSENYGHVIAEAMIVGTPVIISDQTPWNDINDANAGWAIPLNQPEKFTQAIQTIVNNSGDALQQRVFTFVRNRLQLEVIHKQYKDTFEAVYKN